MSIKFTSLTLFLLLPVLLCAQPGFDGSGKLIKVDGTNIRFLGSGKNALKDLTDVAISADSVLKEQSDKAKESARTVLLKKIKETKKLLTDPEVDTTLYNFYKLIWDAPTHTGMIAYLDSLQKGLDSLSTTYFTDSLSSDFIKPVYDNLLPASRSIFYCEFKKSKPTSISFWKRDPFAKCIIAYFNNTLAHKPKISPELADERIKGLGILRDHINSLLSNATKNKVFDILEYKEMRKTHQDLDKVPTAYLETKKLLNTKWFKQWYWLKGGEITLNPFDFTTAEFLKTPASHDGEKAKLWNEYIDSLVKRQMRYDSTGQINEFEKKLRLLNTGEELFSYKKRNDSLAKAIQGKMNDYLTTDKKLNEVDIPASGEFFNFSAVSSIKLGIDKSDLDKPIGTSEKKVIALHNILSSATAGLLEANKTIADKSAFQLGFDTVVTQLGQLAALVLQVTPFGGILDYFNPISKLPMGQITPSMLITQPVQDGSGARYDSFYVNNQTKVYYAEATTKFSVILESSLKNNYGIMDDALYFRKLFEGFDKTVLQVKQSPQLKAEADALLAQYLAKIMLIQVNHLRTDSMMIAHFIGLYKKPLFPNRKLDSVTDKSPTYFTKILETNPSDDAIQKTVKIYTLTKADTVFVDKFSYKIGKYHRFKLGAGLAYTLNQYNQSVASESEGQIKITNEVRQYRFVIGLHVYVVNKGLYSLNDRFCGDPYRFALFFGAGIPAPLENIYTGISYDLVPGLKLTGGVHINRNNKYEIQNNTIIKETRRYQAAGPFLSITVDPVGFINLLNVFQK